MQPGRKVQVQRHLRHERLVTAAHPEQHARQQQLQAVGRRQQPERPLPPARIHLRSPATFNSRAQLNCNLQIVRHVHWPGSRKGCCAPGLEAGCRHSAVAGCHQHKAAAKRHLPAEPCYLGKRCPHSFKLVLVTDLAPCYRHRLTGGSQPSIRLGSDRSLGMTSSGPRSSGKPHSAANVWFTRYFPISSHTCAHATRIRLHEQGSPAQMQSPGSTSQVSRRQEWHRAGVRRPPGKPQRAGGLNIKVRGAAHLPAVGPVAGVDAVVGAQEAVGAGAVGGLLHDHRPVGHRLPQIRHQLPVHLRT